MCAVQNTQLSFKDFDFFSRKDRLVAVRRAAGLFVTDFVSDSSYVGLVSFTSTATKLSDLQRIDEDSRFALYRILTSLTPGGGTGIGSGILTGLEVISSQFAMIKYAESNAFKYHDSPVIIIRHL